MRTIEVTDEELRLLTSAVRAFLEDFGHDQADLLVALKALLQKIQAAAA